MMLFAIGGMYRRVPDSARARSTIHASRDPGLSDTALLLSVFARGLLHRRRITLGSLVDFLTVFGIAARNKMMLINHYQHLEKYEGEVFGPHLALRGALERLSRFCDRFGHGTGACAACGFR